MNADADSRTRLPAWIALVLLTGMLSASILPVAGGAATVENEIGLPEGLVGPMSASDGQAVYLFGGRMADDSVTKDILRIDQNTLEAVKVGELPAPRYAGSAVFLKDKFYIFGGANWVGGAPAASDRIIEFDPDTGEARNLAARLPDGLFNTAAATDGKTAFIFGGFRLDPTPDRRDRIIEFDPNRNFLSAVNTLDERLPAPLHSAAAAYNNENIVIAGGTGEGGLRDEILFFDPGAKTIEVAPFPLPQGVRNAGIVAGDATVHLFGGSTSNGLTRGTNTIVKITSDNATAYNSTLPTDRWFSGSALMGAYAYLIGGQTEYDRHSRNITKIDLTALVQTRSEPTGTPEDDESVAPDPEPEQEPDSSDNSEVSNNSTGGQRTEAPLEPDQNSSRDDNESSSDPSNEDVTSEGILESEPLPAPFMAFLALLGMVLLRQRHKRRG